MPFPSREAQTRIKHEILREYAGAYGGIISRGVGRRSLAEGMLDLAYFDAFAGFGRYAGDLDDPGGTAPVWGSPILALQALAAVQAPPGLRIRVTGILAEQGADAYAELLENLPAAGLDQRIIEASRLDRIDLGAISVLQGDVRDYVDDLLGGLDADVFLLAFIDPFGTSMPMPLLQRLAARSRTDTITLFPVYRVHEYAGSAQKPSSEQTPMDRGNIARNTDHFGSDRWLEIAAQNLPCELAAPQYVELYREGLQGAALGLVVKDIGLSFSRRAEEYGLPGYHLFLTTRNVHGAFRMNAILRQAAYRRYWTHWSDHERREAGRRESRGELELGLGVPYTPVPVVQPAEVVIEEVERRLLESLPAGSYTLRQILGRLADSVFTEGEITKALGALRHQGRARYENLKYASPVEILPTR